MTNSQTSYFLFILIFLSSLFINVFVYKQVLAIEPGGYYCNYTSDCEPNPGGEAHCCTDGSGINYPDEGWGGSHMCASTGGGPYCYSAPDPVIDAGWSDWTAKNGSCGYSGTQTRTCTNPSPANGGAYCSGPSSKDYTNPPCSCSSAGPDGDTTTAQSGTRRTYAYGVSSTVA